MKGHPRGLCGSPAGTPERERSASATPRTEAMTATEPKPLMPGRFDNQRPSEVFVDTPLIDRIGPKVNGGSPIKFLPQHDCIKREEFDSGIDYRTIPERAARGGFDLNPGPSRQRQASTPLRQMPTVLADSYDTILPEHSISHAQIRRNDSDVETMDGWSDSNRPPSDASGETSLVSAALGDRHRAVSEDRSDTQSITWSEALRQSRAKPLAVFYTIPTRFGVYLQNKVRRTGSGGGGAAVFPLGEEEPDNQHAILAAGDLDFIQQIQPHRGVAQQEHRQRTPARSHRSPTPATLPIGRTTVTPRVDQRGPTPPQQVHTVVQVHERKVTSFIMGVSFCLLGILVGICLTFYILLHLETGDPDGSDL